MIMTIRRIIMIMRWMRGIIWIIKLMIMIWMIIMLMMIALPEGTRERGKSEEEGNGRTK